MYKFKFADIGEGLHEGKVGEIYVKVGDEVAEGDSLFSVETDKVTSDIPAPVSGKITEILIKQGETVHVGDDIFHFDTGEESPQEEVKEETKPAEVAEVKDEPKVEAKPESKEQSGGASVVGEVKVSNNLWNNQFVADSAESIKSDGVLTSPLARKLAHEKGIDIKSVPGSGPNGRITTIDVKNFSGSPSGLSKITKVPGQETRVKVSPIRGAISKAMKNSWDNVAYTNLVVEVNMTTLWDQRKATLATKGAVDKLGVKVTFLPFIVKAVSQALEKFPQLNAKYDAKTNEIIQYSDKNIGIAVDAPHGLFVPVVKQAEVKDLVTIAQDINSLALKVRDKKIKPDEMKGGTFSITNYGSVGALYGVPVINFPEIAILGTGGIIDRVMQTPSGQFINGKVMHLTLAADHRWVDGADMGRFLQVVKTKLENPIAMFEEFKNV